MDPRGRVARWLAVALAVGALVFVLAQLVREVVHANHKTGTVEQHLQQTLPATGDALARLGAAVAGLRAEVTAIPSKIPTAGSPSAVPGRPGVAGKVVVVTAPPRTVIITTPGPSTVIATPGPVVTPSPVPTCRQALLGTCLIP